MQKSCTQTFVYLNIKIPKPKYNPKRRFMWLKRYTCSLCNKKYTSSYSIDHSEPKICYSCDF